MRVAVIADESTSLAYRLIGIKYVFAVKTKWDAIKTIRVLREMPDIGLVMIGESIMEYVKEEVDNWNKEKRKIYPIIVSFPDRRSIYEKVEDHIRNLVKRAVGIDILERGDYKWMEKS